MEALTSVNAFLEDTCVLLVIAYALTRGRFLTLLLEEHRSPRNEWLLGIVLGLFGASEYLFPHFRYPYVMQTLFVTFATVCSGIRVGMLASGLIGVTALLHRDTPLRTLPLITAMVVCAALVPLILKRWTLRPFDYRLSFLAGAATQAVMLLLQDAMSAATHVAFSLPTALWSIPANGFGVAMLSLIVTEARLRSDAERYRLEAEKAHALATDFQLSALRARIHPHFLFNTLTSIAVLCRIAPDKAERAVMHLSQLMRRTLEVNVRKSVSLAEEIDSVKAYIAIERLRLGDRLCVEWDIPATCDPELLSLPAFALLTLVENAIQHGIAKRSAPGTVRVRVRHGGPQHLCIAVQDDGCGMTTVLRRNAVSTNGGRPHGLPLLDQQLRLQYGPKARLRIFSKENCGTLVAFQVPLPWPCPT